MQNLGSGTQTATLNTDHQLHSSVNASRLNQIVILTVDASALVNGETLILTIAAPVLTGGTSRTEERIVFKDAQDPPKVTSIPVDAPFGATATLRQEGGTGRSFPWSFDNLAA
jgi:hypothetical protein